MQYWARGSPRDVPANAAADDDEEEDDDDAGADRGHCSPRARA